MGKSYRGILAKTACLAVLAWGGWSASGAVPPRKPAEPVQLDKFDEVTLAIVKGDTRAEVFRINYERRVEPGKDIGVDNYAIVAQGKEPSRQLVHRLMGMVVKVRTYRTKFGFCLRVANRLWKGQDSVVIFYCPDCGRMSVERKDANGQVVVIHGYFASVRDFTQRLKQESFAGQDHLRL